MGANGNPRTGRPAPARRPGARFAFLDHDPPLAFAHRGGALEAEENTLPAFARAIDLGYRYLETDVQATKDGVAVVFHDDTLRRMVGEPGEVREYVWKDLARMRTHGGNPPVRLENLLSAFPQARFNLDPKRDAAVEPMAQAIKRCCSVERICVGSFVGRRVARLRRLLGDKLCWAPARGGVFRLWLSGWGVGSGRLAFPAAQVPTDFHGIPLVTARFVAAAHARGIQVHVWTVNDEARMERLLDLGIDGIMSDRPSLLKEVLKRRNLWTGG